jgi:predicted pyridoxine 5'-phosphate oxidase superfamily flavin-nucleotide-binding protein
MTGIYHEGSRFFQDRFDTRRMADRLEERIVNAALDGEDRTFIESRDMFFIATVDERGFPTCSYKGGDPGFVRVVDQCTLVFPNYDGNGMFLTMGNLRRNSNVGLLFIDWEEPKRLRVTGSARAHFDDPLLVNFPEAQFMVRVSVREVYPNCGRYIHRHALLERSKFVPHAGSQTPVPDWKRQEFVADVLPAKDAANSPG